MERGRRGERYSAFLDLAPDGFVAGESLDPETRRAVRSSTALIAIADRAAFDEGSVYMPLEVARFAEMGKIIIPIDVDGSLRGAREDGAIRQGLTRGPAAARMLDVLLERISVEEPVKPATAPSSQAVAKLKGSLGSVNRSVRRSRIIAATVVVLLALLGSLGFYILYAINQRILSLSNEALSLYVTAQQEAGDRGEPGRAIRPARAAVLTAPPGDPRAEIYRARSAHLAARLARSLDTGSPLNGFYPDAGGKVAVALVAPYSEVRTWDLDAGTEFPPPRIFLGRKLYTAAMDSLIHPPPSARTADLSPSACIPPTSRTARLPACSYSTSNPARVAR